MNTVQGSGKELRYAGYDAKTGEIVHTHSRFNVAENRNVEIPLEELRSRFSLDPVIVERLTDRDPNNLDYIPVEASEIQLGRLMVVDSATRKLVPKPKLHLKATKPVIAGDGEDSTTLEISTVDASGRHLGELSGKVKVATTRGKLSARGGIVELNRGRASLTLTSANETVGVVHVSATAIDRAYAAARLELEFL